MKKLTFKQVVLLLFISSIPVVIEKSSRFSVAAIHHIYFSIDPLLSSQTQQAITDTVNMLYCYDYNPVYLTTFILERFSCVSSISFSYQGDGIAHAVVAAHIPVCYVNDSLVATRNGLLFAASTYVDQPHIFSVRVDQEALGHNMEKLVHCVEMLTNAYGNQIYQLTWHSEHNINLYDPAAHINLICTAQMIEDSAKISDLKETIMHKIIPDNSGDIWVADIRFKDQIVMAMEKRGQYGKNI